MKLPDFPVLKSPKIQILGAVVILIALVVIFQFSLPMAVDWHKIYKPTTTALLQGKSPFSIANYTNAPWTLIPFIPLVLLPENLGRGIIAVACLISILLVARKFGAKPIGMLALLLSPPSVMLIMDGNIDWLALLGFILPPQIGLLFIAIKPQIGLGVVVYWLFHSYRKGGIKEILRVFAPVTMAFAISFILYGFWPLQFKDVLGWSGNASLWPVCIPVGLVLLYRSVKMRNINQAIAASPFLTPYLLLHSYVGLLISFCQETAELVIAVAGLWLVVLIRGLGY